ncbi:MAG: hypothetical protein WDN24_17320 [Sphingomonas sp.]
MDQMLKPLDESPEMLISWDGSRAAEARVREAFPILVQRRSVTLRQSRRVRGGPSAEDVAAWLALHGIATRIERTRRPAAAAPLIGAGFRHRDIAAAG